MMNEAMERGPRVVFCGEAIVLPLSSPPDGWVFLFFKDISGFEWEKWEAGTTRVHVAGGRAFYDCKVSQRDMMILLIEVSQARADGIEKEVARTMGKIKAG